MGLVHLYYGEGKGKSTAAAGLALRSLDAGFPVTVVRFLKNGSRKSGEINILEKLGARILNGKPCSGFIKSLSETERQEVRLKQDEILNMLLSELSEALEKPGPCMSRERGELLILDEALLGVASGLLSEELLKRVVTEGRKSREIVLTGREPREWMLEEADYVTEFCCLKHPYEKGIAARRGVEY